MKKKYKYLSILSILISLSFKAQVSVNVNIGAPPPWAPAVHAEVRYYYLPDIEMYYDVHTANFIYWHNGDWIHARVLPHWHRHYDLYGGYKVVINNYYGPKPYIYYKSHKVKYPKGYKGVPPGQMKKIAGKQGTPKQAPRISNGGGNNKMGKGSKGNGGYKSHGGGKGKH